MATVVTDLSFDNENMTFSGSSEDDIIFAKTFWQSVQLLPPMESRLVSCDIKQRLKRAPPGNQPVNVTYPKEEEPTKLQEFLVKAKQEEKEDEIRKLNSLLTKRQESQLLLGKQRSSRIQKESISAKIRPNREDLERFVFPAVDNDFLESQEEDPKQVMRDLDNFESKYMNEEPDSD